MLTHERICCSYWKICSQRGDAAVAPPSRTWQYAVDSAPMIRIPYYPKPLNPKPCVTTVQNLACAVDSIPNAQNSLWRKTKRRRRHNRKTRKTLKLTRENDQGTGHCWGESLQCHDLEGSKEEMLQSTTTLSFHRRHTR